MLSRFVRAAQQVSVPAALDGARAMSTPVRVNYYNGLPQSEKLKQLAQCRFMERSEFANGCKALEGKKVVIVGCGAQGLNQGLNMRDSGCDVSYVTK